MAAQSPGRRFLVVVAGCAGLLLPLCAAARDKQEPAPQWALDAAKTPTPANVGDAAAVVLSDEYLITVDEQNHAVERERYAVRILKPQGRSYSHCTADYDTDEKLNFFRAWTITSDDRQFQAMETDFKDTGAYEDADLQYSERIRTVNPPASDPGSVVACETEGHLRPYMNAEDWQIQLSIPVVQEALELVLPPGGHFADSWSHYAAVKPVELGPNHLRWEIKNMPALDLENLYATPSWSALAARMSVTWGDLAVNGTGNQWRAIGQWMDQLEAQKPNPTPEVTAKAQQLVAGAPDFYTQLSRITAYIQKNIRYFIVVRGIGGWQSHPAGDIFRNGYGDCKDKTTLLISMLQAIGIHAYYFHVDSRRGVMDPAAPSLLGNHMITAIELPPGENDAQLMARVKTADGKNLLIFDPTDEETPVGLIRAELQGAYGNLADGAGSQVLQMPVLPPQSAELSRTGTFVLGADGSLTGAVNTTMTGGIAASERAYLKSRDDKEVREGLEQSFGSDLPGVTLKSFAFEHVDGLESPLHLNVHLSVLRYAHTAGSLLLLRPHVLGDSVREVPGLMEGKPRRFPIEIGYPGRWSDSFDVTLPPGYTVDETPDPVNVDAGFAQFQSSVTVKGDLLHYQSEYVVRQVEIPANQAAEFRRLEGAIHDGESGTAVLKKR